MSPWRRPAHALPNPGTPEQRRWTAIGQIVGGFGLMIAGGLGDGFGAALSFTGIGAFFGVPAMAVSTTLLVGGAANLGSGLKALPTSARGGGSAAARRRRGR